MSVNERLLAAGRAATRRAWRARTVGDDIPIASKKLGETCVGRRGHRQCV